MRVANLLMMLFLRRSPFFLILTYLCVLSFAAKAQCISSFPFTEHFDQNNGNWTTGGTASDWAWGVPKKKVIFKTNNADKCWVVGGLTGNFYNNNESSWLQSPCFNFSSLKNPYISFLVNWDSERTYDGAALQYSTDNGITWESAGRFGDASGCSDNYWFQTLSIRYGVQAEGWSGSVNDGGSNGWVTAYHSFLNLAGKSNVIFRFVFGAGSYQNNFDGFGVDDFFIGETITDNLAIAYSCNPAPRQASFTAQTNGCVASSSMQWNFDDATSGANNTATGANANHEFLTSRSHEVTLTGKDPRGEIIKVSQKIFIPEVTAVITTPILCNGSFATAEASVTNTNEPASFVWSTNNDVASPTAQGLGAGTFSVTGRLATGCGNSTFITVTEPTAIQHAVQSSPADCNDLNGSISITASGGTPSYTYAWQGSQNTTPSASNLSSGTYTITVTDQNACVDKFDVALSKTPSSLAHAFDLNLPDCGVSNGSIKINTSGGDPAYTYQWTPNVSTGDEATNIASGSYTVIATDTKKCRDTAFITLLSKPVSVSLGRDTFICKGQTLLLKPAGDFASYQWNDGSTLSTKTVSSEGTYSIAVTNTGGCTARDTVHISIGCGDLVFPSVFTPNGDGLNEQFGPTGGLSLVTSYRLLVYNRFGNLVFRSINPYQKWKGESDGKKILGTYTYIATYTYDGAKKMKKGTIVLFY